MHIRFFTFITNWMFKHLHRHFKVNSNQESYFELQKDIFRHHKLEIEQKFNVVISEEINSSEILTFIKDENESQLKNFLTKQPTKIETKKSKKRLKTDKQILITDEEAKYFLLQTVFHYKQEGNN